MPFTTVATSFIGREREIQAISELLRQTRLLTIMGAGGNGKTRLAFEVASRSGGAYPGGHYICELSSENDPATVRAAVASALGLESAPGEQLVPLVTQQFGDRPVLLVLDNCEHLREAVVAVVSDLLGGTKSLSILATTRARLQVPGEVTWTIPGLRLPEADQELEASEAVELLLDRVRARDPEFKITDGNRDAIFKICRRLEGMPLAIELAAGRMALLPPAQVARMLDDSVSLLKAGEGPPRHRTLQSTLDWSYDLLAEEERETLWRLSVFVAPCTLRAAAVVLGDPEAAALDRLAALRDRSLLVAETAGEVARFRLLEPIRQYATDRRRRDGDEAAARRSHATWVLTEAEELAPHLFGGTQLQTVAALRALVPDLQSAFGWSLSNEPSWAARMASATAWTWDFIGRLTEGETLLRASLDTKPDDRELARILGGLSVIAARRGDERNLEYAERAVAAARVGDHAAEMGYGLYALASALVARGREADAQAVFGEALDLADRTGDRLLRASTEMTRAFQLIASGDFAGARSACEDYVPIADELGDLHGEGIGLGNLAHVCLEMHDHVAARAALQRALDLLQQHRNWTMSADLLEYAGRLAARRGRSRDAIRLFGAYRRLLALVDRPIEPATSDETLARLRIAAAEVRSAEAEGAALPVGEMFALARQEAERADSVQRGGLSERELEVARLVARGLSNKEIANRLRRSERTVENHVQHVLEKLDFRSRSQVGAWAQQHGLLD